MHLETAPLNSARNLIQVERAKTPPRGCSNDPDWSCDSNVTSGGRNGGMFTVAFFFLSFQVALATPAPRRPGAAPAAISIRVLGRFRPFSEARAIVD